MTIGTNQMLCNVLKGSNKDREAKTVVSNGGTHTERRLHQMMLEDRDFERNSCSVCCDSWAHRRLRTGSLPEKKKYLKSLLNTRRKARKGENQSRLPSISRLKRDYAAVADLLQLDVQGIKAEMEKCFYSFLRSHHSFGWVDEWADTGSAAFLFLAAGKSSACIRFGSVNVTFGPVSGRGVSEAVFKKPPEARSPDARLRQMHYRIASDILMHCDHGMRDQSHDGLMGFTFNKELGIDVDDDEDTKMTSSLVLEELETQTFY
ncbi:ACT domain-containing protein ACR4-like protein isoform X1 [Tanacetum coccineum]